MHQVWTIAWVGVILPRKCVFFCVFATTAKCQHCDTATVHKSSAGLTGPWGRSCCQREPLSSCSSQKQKPSPWHTVLTPPITTNTRLGTEGGLCKKKKAQETVPLQGAPIKTFLGKANVNPTRCGEDDTPCCTGQFYSSFSKILTLPLNRKRKEKKK